VAIRAVLPDLDGLPWFRSGASKPGKYAADVIVQAQFSPALRSLVEGLGLGGETARAVLRRLSPRQSIPPHVDDWMPKEADWRRFQVPLVTDPAIIMRWPDDGQEAHLAAGWLYEVRFDRLHEVANAADIPRIHLQVDQVGATI
jgi:hypothetical protein